MKAQVPNPTPSRVEATPMDVSDPMPAPLTLKDIPYEQLKGYRDKSMTDFAPWENSTFGTKNIRLNEDIPGARDVILKDAQGNIFYLGPKCPLTAGLYDDLYRMKRAHVVKEELFSISVSPQFELYQRVIYQEMASRGTANVTKYRLDETQKIPKSVLSKEIIARNQYFAKGEYPSDRSKLPLTDRLNDVQLKAIRELNAKDALGRHADSRIGTDESVFRVKNWASLSEDQQIQIMNEVINDENGNPKFLGPDVPLTRARYERVYNVLHSNAVHRPAIMDNPQFAVYQEEIFKALKARGLTVAFREDEKIS